MKKVLKKISILILAVISFVGLVGCGGTNDNDDDDDKYTSETYHWNTPQTDSLKLTKSYEGKDFIKDGIGLVKKVARYVDGDTTIFELASGEQVTIRYNGINTPESTYRIQPWGFAASKYNKGLFEDALNNGAKIVLEAEPNSERLDTTGRYLGWVWLVYPNGDSRLVNLEMAENGYADVKSPGQYTEYFNKAIYDISVKYRLRIYGEKDPGYDYSNSAKEMTIKEIREVYGTDKAIDDARDDFTSPLIKVSGIVVRKNGTSNAYIQQYDADTNEYYGIYVYGGYNLLSKLIKGAYVQITGRIGYYYGSLQITDVTSDSNIKIYSSPDESQIVEIEKSEIDGLDDIYNYQNIGNLVTIHNLRVTGFNDSDNNSSFTLYCKYVDKNGNEKQFNVRVDSGVKLVNPETNKQILSGEYFMGKTFESITGILCYYNGATIKPGTDYANGHIQLALTSMDDVVLK